MTQLYDINGRFFGVCECISPSGIAIVRVEGPPDDSLRQQLIRNLREFRMAHNDVACTEDCTRYDEMTADAILKLFEAPPR